LDTLGFEFLDVILKERFLLPPAELKKIGENVPATLGEVSRLSGMPYEEIYNVLDECLDLGRDIWTDIKDLGEAAGVEGTIIVDMRPDVSFESEPLHESARLFHMQNPSTLLPFLRTCRRVLVISNSEDHAWSAAMALRKMSINAFLPRLP
jgi:hypothetical protein